MKTHSPETTFLALMEELPPAPKPIGQYVPVKVVGNLVYVSGHGPLTSQKTLITGVVGKDLTVAQGAAAARLTGMGILQTLRKQFGSLDQIEEVVRVFGMVRATADFQHHPQVIDGCSELLCEVFGAEAGLGTRCAVGMGSLPQGIVVEIEAIFRLKESVTP